MSTGIVSVFDVIVVDLTASISVQFLVCTLDKRDSLFVHWALNDSQEFIIVDRSIAILVEGVEQDLDVDVGEVEARLLAALREFLEIQGT